MLGRLRLDALIGGNDQQGGVNSGRAGDHRANEFLVTRHVNQVYLAPRQREMCESEGDGHASCLFFREPIRLHAGQGANQRRFAVINMPGDPESDVFGVWHGSPRPDRGAESRHAGLRRLSSGAGHQF